MEKFQDLPRCQGPCLKNPRLWQNIPDIKRKKDLQINGDSSQQLPNISTSASSFFYHSLPLIIFIQKLLASTCQVTSSHFLCKQPFSVKKLLICHPKRWKREAKQTTMSILFLILGYEKPYKVKSS